MLVSKLIRVLHFVPSVSCSAGMVSVIVNYHKRIDPALVRFDYLCLNASDSSNREEEIGRLGGHVWLLSDYGDKLLASISAFFCAHVGEFDIVHCHPIFGAQLVGMAAKRAGASHVIAHSHSTKFSEKELSAKRNRLLSHFVGMFATDYIACSDDARILLGRHGKGAYIMRNAIDCKSFKFDGRARDELRAELGCGEGTIILGHLGRLSPEKNQPFLLDVAKVLKDKGVDFRLVIAGSGECLPSLEAKRLDLGLEGVVNLLGSRSDAPRLYSAFDIFLLPSLFEGVPVSAVEAQVSGLPCILSDAVTREVAFGDCSFLSINNADTWADIVAHMDMSSFDHASRSKSHLLAGEAGFDIRVESAKLTRFYSEICGYGLRSVEYMDISQ